MDERLEGGIVCPYVCMRNRVIHLPKQRNCKYWNCVIYTYFYFFCSRSCFNASWTVYQSILKCSLVTTGHHQQNTHNSNRSLLNINKDLSNGLNTSKSRIQVPASSWPALGVCGHHCADLSCFLPGWWERWDRSVSPLGSTSLECFLWKKGMREGKNRWIIIGKTPMSHFVWM